MDKEEANRKMAIDKCMPVVENTSNQGGTNE